MKNKKKNYVTSFVCWIGNLFSPFLFYFRFCVCFFLMKEINNLFVSKRLFFPVKWKNKVCKIKDKKKNLNAHVFYWLKRLYPFKENGVWPLNFLIKKKSQKNKKKAPVTGFVKINPKVYSLLFWLEWINECS